MAPEADNPMDPPTKPDNKDLESGSMDHPSPPNNSGWHDYDQDVPPMPEDLGETGVTRILTKSSWKDPGPPPNGGVMAWTQAIMAHLVVFNTWGYINSFGVFQTYYVGAFNQPPSAISWVGSIQIFLLLFVGTFSGRLTDAGYFRAIFWTGSVLQLVGVFMTSFSTKYWHLLLAQGICTGLGNGLLFCP